MTKTQVLSEPMFSGKKLISLAIPVIIDSLFVMLVGVIDSTMVASVGSEAVSAVSLVDSITSFFLLVLCALAAGGGVVAAQYVGKGDRENARGCAVQTIYVSLITSLVMTISILAFITPVLKLVYGNLEPTVLKYCEQYFFWILLGFPLYSIGNSCATMLYSQANTKLGLYITATTHIVNAIGNAILIYVFDMGVAGAAIATTFSRIIYATLGILALRIPDAPIYIRNPFRVRFEKEMLKKIFKIGSANGIESGLNQFGSILLSMLVASLGTASVTIFTIVCKIGALAWAIPSALQLVLMTVVGQCIGAGETEQAKMYAKKFIKYTNIAVFTLFISLILFRHQVVRIYALEAELLAECAKHLFYASIGTLLTFYSWVTVPAAVCRASGDTKYAVAVSLIGTFAGRVAFSYLFAIVLNFGTAGMWIGMCAYHLICASLGSIRFKSGKWLTKTVI